MAAKFYPSLAHLSGINKGEKLVYESLHRQLPNDNLVFYSKNLTEKNRFGVAKDREIDFIIFIPLQGILVIEVKGGSILRKNGIWFQNGIEIGSPITQVRDNAYTLKRKLSNHNIMMNIPIAYALWFPEVKGNSGWKAAKDEIEFILFQEDLINPLPKILGAIKSIGSHLPHINHIDKLLKDNLCIDLGQVVLTTKANGNVEEKIIELTENQLKVIDFIENENNAVIQGGAGTGKSIIVVQLAIKEKIKGKKVLILVYNSLIRQFLETAVTEHDEIIVKSFDSLFNFFGLEKSSVNDRNANMKIMASYFDDLEDPLPFDSILIDEAQDFSREFIENLFNHVTIYGENKVSFFCFFDANQAIQVDSEKDFSWKNRFENIINLRVNCRNTKPIYDYAVRFLEPEQQFIKKTWIGDKLPPGEPVKELVYKDYFTDLKRSIIQILSEEFRKGTKINEILIARTSKKIFYDGLSVGGRAIAMSHKFEKDSILSASVRQIKGLESKVVILVVKESHLTTNINCDIYTACTRAKERLYVLKIQGAF